MRIMPSFQNIPQFPHANYSIDVDWRYLEEQIEHATKDDGLDLNPDFQRAHVWTGKQQREYVEYVLMGGECSKVLTFNCPGWQYSLSKCGPYVLVDGKQRLEAVRAFLRGSLSVFGYRFHEYTGHLRMFHSFKWQVCELETRAELLQLYLNINAGGTPHTKAELDKVRKMLRQETDGVGFLATAKR